MVRPADEPVGPSDAAARLIFGRMAGKPNILECVTMELDGEGYAQVHRIPLYPCKLGELNYLSVIMSPDEPKEKQVYLIMLYEVKDENELRFHLLNKDVIGPAIEREEIQGIVKKADPDPNAPPQEQVKPKYREIRLTAETKDLLAFLQQARQGGLQHDGVHHTPAGRAEIAAAIVIAAVSTRRIRGPSETNRQSASRATANSPGENPPSGPIATIASPPITCV